MQDEIKNIKKSLMEPNNHNTSLTVYKGEIKEILNEGIQEAYKSNNLDAVVNVICDRLNKVKKKIRDEKSLEDLDTLVYNLDCDINVSLKNIFSNLFLYVTGEKYLRSLDTEDFTLNNKVTVLIRTILNNLEHTNDVKTEYETIKSLIIRDRYIDNILYELEVFFKG